MNNLFLNISRYAFLFSAGTSTLAVLMSLDAGENGYLKQAIGFAICSIVGYFLVSWVQANDANR